MFKLLIVEDEREIRKGIRNIIDWQSNGITICGEAENGKAALAMTEELKPDILLLDIRMPLMDGLRVLQALTALKSPPKSIILSGYDDFSYVQQCLRLGAADYLLKPCDPDEMLSTVLNVKSLIESEANQREMFERLKTQLDESAPILKEKYLLRLIKGDIQPIKNCGADFQLYHIQLHQSQFKVLLFSIDDFQWYCERRNREELELMKLIVKNIAIESFRQFFPMEVLDNDVELILLINAEGPNAENILVTHLKTITETIQSNYDFTVSVGLGKTYTELELIPRSYYEALQCVETKFFIGTNSVIKYEDIEAMQGEIAYYPISLEKEILNNIRTGKSDELKLNIKYFFQALSLGCHVKGFFKKSILMLLLSLYHFCLEKDLKTDDLFGDRLTLFDAILKIETLEQMELKLEEIAAAIIEITNSRINSNKLIEKAVKFISDNYAQNINLEIVARNVYITPCYLSSLFKQYLGVNFVEYLNKLRIEKACELLQDPHMRAYEVAAKTGFNEERYFYQVFKKITGLTPTQYRENVGECF